MKTFLLAYLRAFLRKKRPVRWMNLRSTVPVSQIFGIERGLPIDRYYIEKFLNENKDHITGNILEIGDDKYTKKFASNIESSYVLCYVEDKQANVRKDDLTYIQSLPERKFDCIICVQTLQFIFDLKSAIQGLKYLLKENGTLLVTLSSVSQISNYDAENYGDFWRFTKYSAEKIFNNEFYGCEIDVKCYGNVLTCVSFLEGLSVEDLSIDELDINDQNYSLLICVSIRNREK